MEVAILFVKMWLIAGVAMTALTLKIDFGDKVPIAAKIVLGTIVTLISIVVSPVVFVASLSSRDAS